MDLCRDRAWNTNAVILIVLAGVRPIAFRPLYSIGANARCTIIHNDTCKPFKENIGRVLSVRERRCVRTDLSLTE